MRSVLFGLNVSPSVADASDPVAEARRAEELGFDFVSSSDHPCGISPTYEVWTMLAWMAAGTSRIVVAPRVLGVPYRPPPIVAKMAESLDRLSGGRLILGLGGGFSDEEFRALGLGVPTPRQKVEGLEEAVRITRGLWSNPDFTFEGRRYSTLDANIEPKPERRIPIWLGTYGKRALAVTGRLADGWIPSLGFVSPDAIPSMRERVMTAAREAGRAPEEITCCYNVTVRVGDHDPRADVVSGTPGEVTEQLRRFIGMGFDAFNFILAAAADREQAELLAREVMAPLRDNM